MTAQERLVIYKKALKDYKKDNNWFWKIFDNSYFTDRGFCWYFAIKNINLHTLPELVSQQPKEFYLEDYIVGYWFKPGELEPRIKCLEKAIEECKLNVYKELQIIKV